ncbi:hypothetical protein Smic_31920 [Streptomyces microflavus]|uniref:Uncharacterized protein n=1 Tax=Streptomyces microflavus TaxID=1919 RepID=A0A7J0CQ57_STRMI|nr:hypothetical protein Smic_31920 [Streptomyces microflavus]
MVIEEADGSIWAVGTTRSGESVEAGLCRQLGGERPDLAARIGCPDIGSGAESPPRAAGAASRGGGAAAPGRAGASPVSGRTETPGRRA